MDYPKELKKFLYPGSPFLGTMQEDVWEKIRDEIVNEGAPVVFTIAVELRLWAPVQVGHLIAEMPRLLGASEDVKSYLSGFTIPLDLIFFSYSGIEEGIRTARRRIEEMTSSKERGFSADHAYLLQHLERCVALLRNEPTAADIFKHAKENPLSRNIHYQVGLEASKLLFVAYLIKVHSTLYVGSTIRFR